MSRGAIPSERTALRSTVALAVALLSSACGLIAGLDDKSAPPRAHGGAGAASSGASSGTSASGARGGMAGSGGAAGTSGAGGVPDERPPSCETGAPGAGFDCGLSGAEDCCESTLVRGGGFERAIATAAVVSDFRLDRFEVTVARFRAFLGAVDRGYRPDAGSGKRTHLDSGSAQGERGWLAAWDDELEVNIEVCTNNNYTSGPGANERQPVTCASYYQAVAFCIWDRGFLPTSAEMMYVMRGGEAEQSYPWGDELDSTRAVYGGASLADVGSKPDGESPWGQRDLIGNVWEIVVDNDWPFQDMRCTEDCALFDETEPRVFALGGSLETTASVLEMADAHQFYRDGTDEMGFRCARAP